MLFQRRSFNVLSLTTWLHYFFADVDTAHFNTQIHFETNSVFFVYDNSTTGHVCNDIRQFVPGFLHNGAGSFLQEGMVTLSLIDDNAQDMN